MKTYHFSVKFLDDDMSYHGEFDTPYDTQGKILKDAKVILNEKLPQWEHTSGQIISYEIYTDDTRETVYHWKK